MCFEIPEYVHFLLCLAGFLVIGIIFFAIMKKMMPSESGTYPR